MEKFCGYIYTSENVKEADLSLLRLAGKIAAIRVLAFMANGTITNDMQKDGKLMEYDNPRILFVRGPPRKVNTTMPNRTWITDIINAHLSYTSCFHTICNHV